MSGTSNRAFRTLELVASGLRSAMMRRVTGSEKRMGLAAALILLLIDAGPARSQDAVKQGEAAVARQREANLKEMKRRLGKVVVRLPQKGGDAELKALEKPL